MAVQVCSGCSQQLAWGLFRCPRCCTVAPLFASRVKEEAMPRITVASGPSNAGAQPGEVGYVKPAAPATGGVVSGELVVELEHPAPFLVAEHGPELVALPEGHVVVLRDYASMTLAELREAAKERGLPAGGSKADLAGRLGGDGVGRVVPAQEEVSA